MRLAYYILDSLSFQTAVRCYLKAGTLEIFRAKLCKKIKVSKQKGSFKNYEGVTLVSRGAEKSFFLLFFTKRTVFGGFGFFSSSALKSDSIFSLPNDSSSH